MSGHQQDCDCNDCRGECVVCGAQDKQPHKPDCRFSEPHEPVQHGHPAFLAILEEIKALHVKKAADYGTTDDCFANMRTEDFGLPGWKYAVLQCKNKLKRLQAYCLNGVLENEGVEDSMLDLAAYAIIALALKREENQNASLRKME